jgi:hypothetical protein
MTLHPFSFMPAALLLASVAAQAPGSTTAQPARSECAMQSLQALISETIYQRQPMSAAREGQGANASGTASDQKFARVRDARFERDGRLVELVVESPDDAANPNGTRRLLAAGAATWDDATKRWLTTDNNLKFVALPEAPKPEAAGGTDGKSLDPKPATDSSTKVKKGQTLLASELLLAPVKIAAQRQVVAAGEPPAAEASLTKGARQNAIVWLVPSERTIVFAVVPHGGKHVPVPWSMLRVADPSGELQFATESNAAKLTDAPNCKDAMEQPSQELRQRCYEHYGVACPKWDRSSEDVDHQPSLSKRDGKSQDR